MTDASVPWQFEAAKLVGEAAAADLVLTIDPDCRDGKCGSCIGGPCQHGCHGTVSLADLGIRHAHYYRQTVAGLACACGETVTA